MSYPYIVKIFTIGIWLLSLSWLPAAAQDVATPSVSSRTNEDPIQVLADWAGKEASAVGCNPGDCRILVTNFRMPEDEDEVVGVQLADELSGKIEETQKQIQIINRDLFKNYLETNHASSEVLKSVQPLSTVAHQWGAQALIMAIAMKVQGDTFRVSVRLMNVTDKNMAVTTEVNITRISDSDKPIAAAPAARPKLITHPSCYYMPNPPYSEQARAANFNGVIPVEAVIQADGTVSNLRILKSPGMGLDELLLKTMDQWKCHPQPKRRPYACQNSVSD